MSETAALPRDKTFRAFSEEQGVSYAEHRRDYHPKFYQLVLDHHTSQGGQLETILDVGCGPGFAVRALGPRFTNAIGIDPSEGMLRTARSLGGESGNGDPIRFEIGTAESLGSDLSPPIRDGSVDLIVAATASHWFNMSEFWARAAQVLKPNGTVALWTSGRITISPSVPNAQAVQAALDGLDQRLDDYMVPGNRLARDLYRSMPLPWTLSEPIPEFDEASFVRKEWGTDSPGSAPGDEYYYYSLPQPKISLDMIEKIFGTSSPVIRWREAHAEAVGTENDIVRQTRREIERAVHAGGMEKGKELLEGSVSAVLLMVKKRV
ncbi:hypothetical protein jhhlp_008556 [Lomentospora prolificans]|uniref:Methyltransferase type 11 domain-containing protein n=1 Tax=Lomentospora prolificans TaxID=41688 RepID=A0A2N3MYD4_9PEZI|nr:hypothetical protein jhhlp_008556 [Lomentospora prolificans]